MTTTCELRVLGLLTANRDGLTLEEIQERLAGEHQGHLVVHELNRMYKQELVVRDQVDGEATYFVNPSLVRADAPKDPPAKQIPLDALRESGDGGMPIKALTERTGLSRFRIHKMVERGEIVAAGKTTNRRVYHPDYAPDVKREEDPAPKLAVSFSCNLPTNLHELSAADFEGISYTPARKDLADHARQAREDYIRSRCDPAVLDAWDSVIQQLDTLAAL